MISLMHYINIKMMIGYMNKKILILVLILLFSGCSNNQIKHISNRLNLNLDSCKIIEYNDTHGGFLGDGTYFAKLECASIDTKNFKELPLSEEIQKILDVEWCDSTGCYNFYKKNNIPKIKNGYYYFYYRHSDSTNHFDDKDLNNRSSWNFTIAIYDLDTKVIYFYELDT